MKNAYTIIWKLRLLLIVLFIQLSGEAYASHAQGGDLTYTCLGGNQYLLRLSFYRDCSGTAAPGSVVINTSSASCNQNFNTTLYPIPGTGIDVTPICPQMQTVCNGGNNPGVQEWIYEGIINLPAACTDWVFSFNLCCRNAAINTIVNPGGQNIYIETTLNNVAAPCNNSPAFSNDPVPFVCAGQTYCFNHGALDPDGDSLAYSLVNPMSGPAQPVTFIAPYSTTQPIPSSPAMTLNPVTGDICMTPSQIIVAVMSVRVEEWRNGILIGTVVRDIQVRTVMCNNQLPYTAGINNTNVYSATICAGSPFTFNVNAFDADPGQVVTMSWNNGIPAASFTVTGSPLPTGVFSWTPTTADINTIPYCFTVTVSDDACPYSGSQTFAFCITVSGFSVGVTTTATNCGASNGTASALATGGTGPYSFNWQPSGGNNANANGLTAGTYTVYVTDAAGCVMSAVAVVPSGPANSNINATYSNINCFGGTQNIYLNVNGGQQPYTYAWSNNTTNQDLLNATAGVYSVTVTTASGCTTTATYTITQPSSPLNVSAVLVNNVSCANGYDGQVNALATGGTAPYSYSWNSTPAQATASAFGLNSGNYNVVVTDANGCTSLQSVTVTEPLPVTANIVTADVTCYGGSNGSASVNASGGTGSFNFSWNTVPSQSGNTVLNLQAGNYTATVTDANGCTSAINAVITEPPALNALIGAVTSVSCNAGNNGSATVQASGGTAPYTYNWNTNPIQNAPVAANMIAGTFTVTVTDANGCATISTVTITQPSPVAVIVSPSDTICPNSPFYITAIGSGGNGNFTYNWSPNIGNGNAYTVYASTQTTWTVTAVDANGCSSMPSTITADVYQFTPANLQIVSTPAICAGGNAVITTLVNGNTGPLTWNWNNNLFGPGPHTVYPAVTTTYSVNVSNICGVVVPAVTTVTVNPLPLVNVPSQNASGCDEVSLVFQDTTSANQNCFYFWDFGDNSTGTGNNPQHSYNSSGTYTLSITATSPAGCVGTSNSLVSVIVYDSPIANFTMSRTEASLIEPTIMFEDESSTNTIGWFWDFGDSTTSTVASPVHTYQREGTFNVKLVAVATGGCTDTLVQPLEIIPEFTVFIPNAFTPNADGTNDVFYVYGEEITTFEMMIFDRWGNKIYESDDLSEGWDGRANDGSAIAQQDVYVYKVILKDFEGRTHKYNGHVSLLK